MIWKCADIGEYNGNVVGYIMMVDASTVEVSLHTEGASK
jgi:hypothetical protein